MAQFEEFVKDTMPKIKHLSKLAADSTLIDTSFYGMYDVKRDRKSVV